jgi:Aspartyl protease
MVRAVFNQQEYATLLLDTGAGQSFVTPDTAQRLGLSPVADTPTRTTTVVGGRQVEVPVARLATLAIGNARRDKSIGNSKAFSPRSLRRPPPPAATPCSRHVRRPQRCGRPAGAARSKV